MSKHIGQKDHQYPWGLTCPFCKSYVLEDAKVCAACGARKATRADKERGSGLLMRFAFWACSVGLAYALVALVPTWIWKHANGQWSGGRITTFHVEMEVIKFLGQQGLGMVGVYALLAGAVMMFIARIVSRVWRAIFGSITDPIWLR